MNQKISINKKFIYFVLLAPILLLIISILSGIISFYILSNIKKERLPQYAEIAEEIINDSMILAENSALFVSEKIGNRSNLTKSEMEKVIAQIDGLSSIDDEIDFLQYVGFIDKNSSYHIELYQNKLTNKPTYQPEIILKNLTGPYIAETYSDSEDNLLLPVIFKITNKNKIDIGYFYVLLNLKKMVDNIKRNLQSDEVEFIIMNAQGEYLTSSIKDIVELSLPYNKLDLPNKNKLKKFDLADTAFSYLVKLNNANLYILVGIKKIEVRKSFQELFFPEFIEAFSIGLILMFLFSSFKKHVLSPIVDLSDKAKAISNGDFSQEVKESNLSEIDYLATSIRQVKEKLITEVQMILDLQAANEAISRQAEEIKEAVEVKQRFLNNMSHELKTPLHGIIGMSECLEEDWERLAEKDKKKLISEIYQNSERLLNLISNLLDFSKFEAGRMDYIFKQADLVEIVETVITEYKALYKNKGLAVDLNIKEGIERFVKIDEDRIMQVIRNLLGNAIRYSDNGTIKISIYDTVYNFADIGEKKSIVFSIKDEGIGIKEEELKEIFNPFTQSSKTRSRAGGTGLGLSICKEIVKAHKGEIWAENNKESVGTTFFVVIMYN